MLKNNGGQAHVFLTAVVGSQAADFTPSSFPPNLLPQRGLPESQDGVSTIILGQKTSHRASWTSPGHGNQQTLHEQAGRWFEVFRLHLWTPLQAEARLLVPHPNPGCSHWFLLTPALDPRKNTNFWFPITTPMRYIKIEGQTGLMTQWHGGA